MKKVDPRALVAKEGEYISGGEESEDDEQQVGMASMAIGVTSSSQGSLFTNPNDKTSPTKHKCFMAKGVPPKVTSTPKIAISSTPSLLDCVEKVEDKNANQVHLSNLMKSFEGYHKIAFDALMNQLDEANGLIDEQDDKILELESFARDDSLRIADLEEALEESQCYKKLIEENFIIYLSKMMGDREHALSKVKEFIVENDDLKNGHLKLLKDFEQLEKSHMALSSELKALKRSHVVSQPRDINANSCATNPLCVKASLIKENNRLKDQLEKGLVTCIQ